MRCASAKLEDERLSGNYLQLPPLHWLDKWCNIRLSARTGQWTPVRINRTNFKVKLPRHISDNLYCFRLKCEIYIKLTSSSWNVSKVQRLAGETRDNTEKCALIVVQYLQSLWTYFWGIYFHFILWDTEVDFVYSVKCFTFHIKIVCNALKKAPSVEKDFNII